jgi:molybdopterin converting factor small subunit
MLIVVHFYSYFKDLTGCEQITETLPEGSTIDNLLEMLARRFPKFGLMRKSTLTAVGVDYQQGSYALKEGEEVSLFPPVQGG